MLGESEVSLGCILSSSLWDLVSNLEWNTIKLGGFGEVLRTGGKDCQFINTYFNGKKPSGGELVVI